MNTPEIPSDEQQDDRIDDAREIALLAGKLAHEIKNPLSTIRMNMELLGEDFADAVALARSSRASPKFAWSRANARGCRPSWTIF
ncbi:MAG: histidine kinase dimerization/phospho-acceptor domain-containing protein [Pirellulales bacterium]